MRRLWQFLLPNFTDAQENTRLKDLASYIALSALVLTCLAILPAVTVLPASLPSLALAAVLVLFFLAAYVLARRGRVRAGSLVLTFTLWAAVTFLTQAFGGLDAQGFSAYLVVVFVASLLLGTRMGVLFFGLSLASGLSVILVELPASFSLALLPVSPFLLRTSQVVLFIATVVLLQLALRHLQAALARARRHERRLERRAVQIQAAAEVAGEAAEVRELDDLLNRTIQLIRDRFGFYYAAIFLIEDPNDTASKAASSQAIPGNGSDPEKTRPTRYAVLKAATGEAGRQLLASGHRLRVGEVGMVGYVAASGKPRIAVDVDLDNVHWKNPWLPNTRSEMVLPLKIGARVIGLLDVQSEVESAFDGDDLAVLQTLADQLAVAMETARLFDATHRQLEELTLLHTVAMAAAQASEEDELIERATEVIGSSLFPDNFGVLLLDEKTAELHAHRSYRERAGIQQFPIPVGSGITGLVALNGRARRLGDVSLEPNYLFVDPLTRSELCVPLKSGSRIFGVINAESVSPNAFSPADERLLGTLAGQLALAIEKFRLFEAERRRRDEAEILRDATAALISTLDLEQILDQILEHLKAVVPFDSACVFLLEGEHVHAVTARDLPEPDQVIGKYFPASDSLIQEILTRRQAVIIENVYADPRFQAWGGTDYARGWMGIPLIVRGVILGCLTLDSRKAGAYGHPESNLAQALANQAAGAIQNARLFESEQRRRAELEALRQASLHLTSNLEWQPVLQAILAQALELVAANQARIFLYEKDRLTFGAALSAGNAAEDEPAGPPVEEWAATIARLAERDLVPDISRHPLLKEQAREGALIGLPLRVGERVLGVMVLAFSEPHFFDPNELRILELLADQAAVPLENAHLYAEAQDRAHELAAALAQLRELDRLKDEFIQNVSHELRTPMAIVRGYAELLDSGELGELQPEQRGPVSIIARRTRLLTRMLDDLLAILEVEANHIRGEPVDLAGLVRSLLSEYTTHLESAGLALTTEIDPNLPPISGNSAHLRRMVDNLIGNALKFTPSGGSIRVCLQAERQDVLLEVADTGIGIPSDQVDRIFDRFYQVNGATTRRYGGAGLGLALVKEIVEAHGGQVRVTSTLGKGSSFQVVLPAWDQGLQ